MSKREVTVKAESLRTIRKLSKLSQGELASLATEALRVATGDPGANVSESLVALVETKRRQPSLRNAQAFAAGMGVELESFATINTDDERLAS